MRTKTNGLVARERGLMVMLPLAGAAVLAAVAVHAGGTVHAAALESSDAAPLTVAAPVSGQTTAFARIAKAVGPAVVNINTETLPQATARGLRRGAPSPDAEGDDSEQGGGDDQQRDFFRRFFGGEDPRGGLDPRMGEQRGLGSGFVVDPNGYIVTNQHVINKADRIFVKLTTDPVNDQGHRARVIGEDKDTDLAVIKIDVGHPLPTVKLGNSDSAEVGDAVEAIGSPFDLSQTVTAGIISAKNRSIVGGVGGQFKHFIQTDAAINPGNSGGPLLNMDGQVVGVNTAIISQSNGYMGIGFSMPSNTVVEVYNQLVAPRHAVVRGSIGISFQPNVSTAVAKMYHASSGVLVAAVTPGRAAERAGLRANDVITSVDGRPVKDGDDLVTTITARKPGSTVTIGYLRQGQTLSTRCTVEDRSALTTVATNEGAGPSRDSGAAEPAKTILGVGVADLPADAGKGRHGVVIRSVTPGSFADELTPGVAQGVVIEALNRTPIKSKAELDAMASRLKPGDDVVLEVRYPDSDGQSTLTGATLP